MAVAVDIFNFLTMKIIITKDMPYMELYKGHVIPYFSMTEKSLIGLLNNELTIFPLTCATIDYSKEVQDTVERMETIDDTKNLEI